MGSTDELTVRDSFGRWSLTTEQYDHVMTSNADDTTSGSIHSLGKPRTPALIRSKANVLFPQLAKGLIDMSGLEQGCHVAMFVQLVAGCVR